MSGVVNEKNIIRAKFDYKYFSFIAQQMLHIKMIHMKNNTEQPDRPTVIRTFNIETYNIHV